MRMFAATSPDQPMPRKVVPADILRRLAFGRPQRRQIQPAAPVSPAQTAPAVEAAAPQSDHSWDLDQRVRLSGEW
jgi:hypothetical protein